MSAADDTLAIIARELIRAVQPFRRAVSSDTNFKIFLYRLGWNANMIPNFYKDLGDDISDAVNAVDSFIASPSVSKIMPLFNALKDIFEKMFELASANWNDPSVVAKYIPTGLGAQAQHFLEELGGRLFELLLTDYLSSAAPATYNFLQMLGIVSIQFVKADDAKGRPSYTYAKFNWEEIPKVFSEPDKLPQKVLGWGTADFRFERLANWMVQIFAALRFPASLRPVDPELAAAWAPGADLSKQPVRVVLPFFYMNIGGTVKEFAFEIHELPAEGAKLPGLIIMPSIPSEVELKLRLSETVDLRLKAGSNINNLFGLVIRPNEIAVKYPFSDATTLPELGFGVGFTFKPPTPRVLLGQAEGTRLELAEFDLDLGFNYTYGGDPEIIFGAELKGLAIVMKAGEGDSFMRTLLGDGDSRIEVPLGFEWSSKKGFRFKGSASFEVALHPHLELGPISIDEIQLRLRGDFNAKKLVFDAGLNIGASLGPLAATVQGIGMALNMKFEKGNAGPFDISVGFKPPTGVGLSIDAGGFKGGGFLSLDYDHGRYVGALEISFQDFLTLKAIGIVTTKMPDGSEGFSLLIVISAEFQPIQLGFGFTLNGVGGLLALNRTMNVDAIREGVRHNTLKSILFPENIIENINQIISDLETIFPIQQGKFVFGPMLSIGWGTPTLVKVELGLLVEVPDPVRIAIVGVIRAILPTEDFAILKLQVNFAAILDFEKKLFSLDASLYDSKLLTFTLTGDMAVRFSWGDPPGFLFSIGGFHPDFQPPPLQLPDMRRLTISLLAEDNPRLTIEVYFAITSNSVQIGAKVEFYAAAWKFNIYGYLSFDALLQFSPFHFSVGFGAMLAVRWGEDPILSVELSAKLSGPTPWNINGTASFSILFFEISVHVDVTWGEDSNDPANFADIIEELSKALKAPKNWEAKMPKSHNHLVSVKMKELPPDPDKIDDIIVHPAGSLTISQTVLPLGVAVEKFGHKKPKNAKRFDITSVTYGGSAVGDVLERKDHFAAAQFFEMGDAEKLSRPSFEKMKSGVVLKDLAHGVDSSRVCVRTIRYDLRILDSHFRRNDTFLFFPPAKWFDALLRGNAAAKSPRAQGIKPGFGGPVINPAVNDDQFAIVDTTGMNVFAGHDSIGSWTEAEQIMTGIMSEQPDLHGQLQIVPNFELMAI